MDCADARLLFSDLGRRRLEPPARDPVERHLQVCQSCRTALEAERALDDLLERSIPRQLAPDALCDRLPGLVTAPESAEDGHFGRRPAWRRMAMPALAAGLALALGGVLMERRAADATRAEGLLTEELVTDHLRILASQRPAEIESGGSHQVKPWFEGRIDFAPVVPAPEEAGVVLRGGAVGYVLDRRAAVLHYTLRLHRLTLLVVRAEGWPWPAGAPRVTEARGFHVVRWRAGQLGYALVSDVNAGELTGVAEAFQAVTGR
jgi:anti-sigma factor RsiW